MLENKDLKIGQQLKCLGQFYNGLKDDVIIVDGFVDKEHSVQKSDMIITKDHGLLYTHDFEPTTQSYFVAVVYTAGWRDPEAAAQRFANCMVDIEEPMHLVIDKVQEMISLEFSVKLKLQHVNAVIISYQKV